MKRRIFIIIIIIAAVLALTSIGFAAWGIIGSQSGKAEGDFTGYPIVDLNDAATSSISAFQYKETGFVGANQYSTSFSVTFELTQKDEAYNVSVELIDEDSFLSNKWSRPL